MASSSDILPMPTPTLPSKPLREYKLLSFDVYGTLIDWEISRDTLLKPLISRLPPSHPLNDRVALAARFNRHSASIQSSNPTMLYSKVLYECYIALAEELNVLEPPSSESQIRSEAESLSRSVGEWTAFPDTVPALHRLRKHYKYLIPLSNVDRESFSATLSGPLESFPFTAHYLAEDIGTYKPNLNNFRYLLSHVKSDYDVEKDEVLHVAQSLFHDHVATKEMGMHSVWIARKGVGMSGGAADMHREGRVGYEKRYGSLAEFADEVEREAEAVRQ